MVWFFVAAVGVESSASRSVGSTAGGVGEINTTADGLNDSSDGDQSA
jgi:hypothetical protein